MCETQKKRVATGKTMMKDTWNHAQVDDLVLPVTSAKNRVPRDILFAPST